MDIDINTAVGTLVRAAMGQDPDNRVTVGLIVAVLARKFAVFPETHLARLVIQAILDIGGKVDLSIPVRVPADIRRSA